MPSSGHKISRHELDELYEAEQADIELPAIDEATVSMPNLANSTLADVLVSEADHAALTDVAAKQQLQVSDVI